MSDDGPDCDREKERPTRLVGTGKELLDWLTPTSGSKRVSAEQSPGESETDSTLDRRSYMLLAGGAAAAAATGAVASSSVSGSSTEIHQPDVYGYGGRVLEPHGQHTTLLSGETGTDALTSSTPVRGNAERAQAMEIASGVTVYANLDPASNDWFVFEADADDSIVVEYERETSRGMTGLLLYDPDGNLKDMLYVGTGNPHTLRSLADENGEHFLQVIEVANGDGDYTFRLLLDDDDDDNDDDNGDDDDDDNGDNGDDYGELGYGEGPYGGIDR